MMLTGGAIMPSPITSGCRGGSLRRDCPMKTLLCAVIFMLIAGLGMTQTATQPASDMITVHRGDLTPEQLKLVESKQALEQAKTEAGKYAEFIGLGKAVGVGMREGLEALTDNADKFSKTDVGHFTMFLIAYRIIGEDLIQLLIGLPLFIICTTAIIWSYRRNCVPHRIKISDAGLGKAKQWQIIDPSGNDGDTMWGHFIAWVLATLVCSLICFL